MFIAYRIRPVVESTDPDGKVSYRACASLSEAEQEVNQFNNRNSFSGREGKTVVWGIYGVNAPENGVSTEDAISDTLCEESAKRLLEKIIGPFTTDAQGYCTRVSPLIVTQPIIPDYTSAPTEKLIIARFVPQIWVNDNAMEIDGAVEFDVTDKVLAMSPSERAALRDDSHASDHLVPDHMLRNHNGPFRVEVEQAIKDYFDSIEECPPPQTEQCAPQQWGALISTPFEPI
jgi:hypothetical protein